MTQNLKNKNNLKNFPFCSEETESVKKKNKKKKKIAILKFLLKNLKNYLINSYQIYYHFHQKKKDLKDY